MFLLVWKQVVWCSFHPATGFLLLQLWNLFLQMKNPSGFELCNFASYQHNSLRQFPRLSINHIPKNSAASNIHRFYALLCQKYKLILQKEEVTCLVEFGRIFLFFCLTLELMWSQEGGVFFILSKSKLCTERMYCVKGDPNLSPYPLLVTFLLKLHLIRTKLNPPGVLDICTKLLVNWKYKTTNLYQ